MKRISMRFSFGFGFNFASKDLVSSSMKKPFCLSLTHSLALSLSIYLSIYLSISLSLSKSVSVSVCLSFTDNNIFICLSTRASVCSQSIVFIYGLVPTLQKHLFKISFQYCLTHFSSFSLPRSLSCMHHKLSIYLTYIKLSYSYEVLFHLTNEEVQLVGSL